MDECGLSGHRLHDRYSPGHGEACEFIHRTGVVDAPSCDEQRLLCCAECSRCCIDLPDIGTRSADVVQRVVEEWNREVVCLGCNVLRQTNVRRTAIGRIEHDAERLGECLDDLLGASDAVPEAGDRPECVAHRR